MQLGNLHWRWDDVVTAAEKGIALYRMHVWDMVLQW